MTATLLDSLRLCTRTAIAVLRQDLPAQWRAVAQTGQPPAGTLVVWLALHAKQQMSVACIDHACLLHAAYGSRDLPVELVTPDMIQRVAQDYFRPFTLSIGPRAAPVDRVEVTGVARCDDTSPFLSLQCDVGTLYLRDPNVLKVLPAPAGLPQTPGWETLPCRVHLTLGHSALSARELARLAPGDVLRVLHDDPVLAVGERSLFHFFYDGRTVMIEEPIDVRHDAPHLGQAGLSEATVADLPIELRVVLAEKTLPLAELAGLAQGDVMTLPHASFERVSVFAGQTLVAHGELVRLADGLAVEIAAVHAHGSK